MLKTTEDEQRTLINKAHQLREEKKYQESLNVFLKILSTDPKHSEALFGIALLATISNMPDKVNEYGYRALKLKNITSERACDLGKLFSQIKSTNYAAEAFTLSLSLDPRSVVATRLLAKLYFENKNYPKARDYCLKVIKIEPNAPHYSLLGNCYKKLEQIDKAIDAHTNALNIDLNYSPAKRGLASALHDKGEIEEATRYIEEAIKDGDAEVIPALYYDLSQIKKFTASSSRDQQVIQSITKHLASERYSNAQRTSLHFALGKIYNDIKDYRLAFEHYSTANNLKSTALNYDINNSLYSQELAKHVFTKTLYKQLQPAGLQNRLNGFIVGMPRSGTTLTYQILTSHSKIEGIGEFTELSHVIQSIKPRKIKELFGSLTSYPECIPYIEHKEIRSLASLYEEQTKKYIYSRTPNTEPFQHIFNKLPQNFMHLGFIKTLFPNSKIIHCYRHPLDVCLSNYFQNFANIEFSSSIEDISLMYKKYYSMMKHWQATYNDTILNVFYEETVSDFEKTAHNMINFLELKWEDNCLNFKENKNEIYTASRWQARQPIYDSSKYRWKHYEPYIGDLIKNLKEEIADYEDQLNQRITVN